MIWISAAIVWSIVGFLVFFFFGEKLTRGSRTKLYVTAFLSGPLVWGIVIGFMIWFRRHIP